MTFCRLILVTVNSAQRYSFEQDSNYTRDLTVSQPYVGHIAQTMPKETPPTRSTDLDI